MIKGTTSRSGALAWASKRWPSLYWTTPPIWPPTWATTTTGTVCSWWMRRKVGFGWPWEKRRSFGFRIMMSCIIIIVMDFSKRFSISLKYFINFSFILLCYGIFILYWYFMILFHFFILFHFILLFYYFKGGKWYYDCYWI